MCAETMTIRDVMRICRVSRKTVERWIRNEELLASKLGRQWQIDPIDLEKFLKMNRNV